MTTDNKTTSDSALGIATAYHEAWTSGDLDKAMSFMAEDVIVHAPGKELNGKEEYRAYLGGFMKVMEGHTPHAAFGDGSTAVLYYFPHTPSTRSARLVMRRPRVLHDPAPPGRDLHGSGSQGTSSHRERSYPQVVSTGLCRVVWVLGMSPLPLCTRPIRDLQLG